MINLAQRREYAKLRTAKFKALEICNYCWREKVFKLKTRGKQTLIRTKCFRCLRKHAWLQAEYKDRLKMK